MLSRRSFLKVAGAALAAAALPRHPGRAAAGYDLWQGRMIGYLAQTYDRPSLSGEKLEALAGDTVVDIAGVTVGDEQPAHNRVWYMLEGGAYVHSGAVQPVKTALNPALAEAPADGLLAEVSVPYSDVRWGPSTDYYVAYRLYYASTHWITAVLSRPDGATWYKVYDDRKRMAYWGRAEHFRPVPEEELTPIRPETPPEEKWLQVNLAQQWVTAFEGQRPVFQARVATGAVFSSGDFRTPRGSFQTRRKRPSRHMAGGDLAADDGFDLPGVPWVSYFTNSGVSLHGTYWHNDFGRPRSHGCVNLTPQAAKWIYRWTLPHVPPGEGLVWEAEGTRVEVI